MAVFCGLLKPYTPFQNFAGVEDGVFNLQFCFLFIQGLDSFCFLFKIIQKMWDFLPSSKWFLVLSFFVYHFQICFRGGEWNCLKISESFSWERIFFVPFCNFVFCFCRMNWRFWILRSGMKGRCLLNVLWVLKLKSHSRKFALVFLEPVAILVQR